MSLCTAPRFLENNRMTLNAFALLCLAALCTAVSNLLVRNTLSRGAVSFSPAGILDLARQPLLLLAGVLFAAGTLMWFRIVSSESLSTVFPLYVGLTFFLVMIGAFSFLG